MRTRAALSHCWKGERSGGSPSEARALFSGRSALRRCRYSIQAWPIASRTRSQRPRPGIQPGPYGGTPARGRGATVCISATAGVSDASAAARAQAKRNPRRRGLCARLAVPPPHSWPRLMPILRSAPRQGLPGSPAGPIVQSYPSRKVQHRRGLDRAVGVGPMLRHSTKFGVETLRSPGAWNGAHQAPP
jgi:hypothetical protein